MRARDERAARNLERAQVDPSVVGTPDLSPKHRPPPDPGGVSGDMERGPFQKVHQNRDQVFRNHGGWPPER